MIWLIMHDSKSHEVSGCNIHFKDDKFQLWIEKPSGKSVLIKESGYEAEVRTVKLAIDLAVEQGLPTIRI